MYKKYVSSIFILLLAAGCSTNIANGQQKEEPLTVGIMAPSQTELADKTLQLSVDIIHPTTKETVYSFEPDLKLKEKEYQKELKELVKEMASEFDQPMIPVKINNNGELTKGQSRILLNEKKLLNSLSSLGAFDRRIELPLSEVEPNVSKEAVSGLDEVVIGSYKTTFNAAVTGRSQNIALSANELNQVILGPGDRFYFNLVVGERTVEKGYQKALEIVDKEFVEGIGGGICQTSSTLYNAVDAAGLEIIEVHSHSRSVGYVPAGRDATVSWGGPDFKFKNNKDYPVMIKTIVDKTTGSIEVQVLSSKEAVEKM